MILAALIGTGTPIVKFFLLYDYIIYASQMELKCWNWKKFEFPTFFRILMYLDLAKSFAIEKEKYKDNEKI